MRRVFSQAGPIGRGVFLVLALVALLTRIAIPPGAMVASTDRGAALVICTGHGPLALPGPDGPSKPAGKSDGGCAFAAHASVGLAENVAAFGTIVGWSPAMGCSPTSAPTPGCGLAAPPPPSQAPPTLLV